MRFTKERVTEIILEEIENLKEDEFSDAAKESEQQAIESNKEIAELAKPLIQNIVASIEEAVESISAKNPAKYPEDQVRITIKGTLTRILTNM
jgi:hypothetical protein|tara:strand:+ start:466 stop:744 length:279 start_codon:yes stop_codon:yes gene_type:complete